MGGELSDDECRELLVHYAEIRDDIIRAVRCPHLGADLTQETYYRAFRTCARRGRARDTLAWLQAIARNAVRDHFRRLNAGSPFEPHDEELLIDRRTDDFVSDAVPWDIDSNALTEAVDSLPPLQRALIIGFYFEGKGCEALGIEFGIHRVYVRVRLHRARKRLRDQLSKRQGGSP